MGLGLATRPGRDLGIRGSRLDWRSRLERRYGARDLLPLALGCVFLPAPMCRFRGRYGCRFRVPVRSVGMELDAGMGKRLQTKDEVVDESFVE